jgi:hypothetical protein
MKAIRVSVWHGTIKPEDRNSRNLGDGALFFSRKAVMQYQQEVIFGGGEIASLSVIENPTVAYTSLEEWKAVGKMSLAELLALKNREITEEMVPQDDRID